MLALHAQVAVLRYRRRIPGTIENLGCVTVVGWIRAAGYLPFVLSLSKNNGNYGCRTNGLLMSRFSDALGGHIDTAETMTIQEYATVRSINKIVRQVWTKGDKQWS